MATSQKRRTIDTKRYMSNTDKSIHNLKYVLADPNKPLSPAPTSRRAPTESGVVTRRTISYDLVSPVQKNYYPFGSPTTSGPVQSRRITPSWLDKGTDRKPKLIARVDQRDRAMNLFDGKKRNLKVEHYHVDSAEEAEDLIVRLKQQGFVPATIETQSDETN